MGPETACLQTDCAQGCKPRIFILNTGINQHSKVVTLVFYIFLLWTYPDWLLCPRHTVDARQVWMFFSSNTRIAPIKIDSQGAPGDWKCAGDPNQTCAGSRPSRHSYTPIINETRTFGFVWKVCYQKIQYGLSMFIMIIPSKLPFWGIPCNLWTISKKGWWINLSAKSNGFRKWSCTAERFCRILKVVLVQLVCAAMRLAQRYLRYFVANLLRARLFWYILKK